MKAKNEPPSTTNTQQVLTGYPICAGLMEFQPPSGRLDCQWMAGVSLSLLPRGWDCCFNIFLADMVLISALSFTSQLLPNEPAHTAVGAWAQGPSPNKSTSADSHCWRSS